MSDIIKSQYESGKALSQSRYYGIVNRAHWPKFNWNLYPMVQEYYHELNPYFLYSYTEKKFFRLAEATTVRDGYVTFAAFMLQNFRTFTKLNHHFIIHPELAPIVPENLRSYFSCWHLSQPKRIEIENAHEVMVFGLLCDQYVGNFEKLAQRLSVLKRAKLDARIELFLLMRTDPLGGVDRETNLSLEVMNLIKDLIPLRQVHFMKTRQFFAKTQFNSTYLLDIAPDNFLVSDNYVHYYIASKGGSVNKIPKERPANSVFDLAVSFNHNLHVTPLPEVESIFPELLFESKASGKDMTYDPILHQKLIELLKVSR